MEGALAIQNQVRARKTHYRKHKHHHHGHHKHRGSGESGNNGKAIPAPTASPSPTPSPTPAFAPPPPSPYEPYPKQSIIFDVLSFGAKGDGIADDSKAFQDAWKAACKVAGAIVEIPSEFKFLINPITLQGPCMPHLVLQIDGTLLAPPNIGSWSKSSLFQWINFKWIQNFTIQGTGTVDGQGSAWWNLGELNHIEVITLYKQLLFEIELLQFEINALRFYASYSVTVRDIRIINSPLCHLKFDNSGSVKVDNITISSPENSPNTDGIHLQNSKDVEILNSNIGCGDDCVSIQTGCSNIHVHHTNCGPGHGISLGSLGKDKSAACVKDIVVDNILMQNTLYGARIKTWQGGVGSVKNVSFSNIQVSDVKVPIMIDQFYCDKQKCKNQTEAVAISGVTYNQIIGTYSVQPIHLACSNDVPCTNVDLIGIQLEQSSVSRGFHQALCWNSFGKSQAPLVPSSMDYCLRRGGGSSKRPEKSHDLAC
ncbi:Glycoside hydrolase [Macleaya cordata]|uniref:Glycoside hydrolase n=1 Tax=Macleaya cordata TaxID=56857 RepID=A0A200RDH3_MACCD|nr:Glycoside hydrolase [Macleaya cordata]